MRTLVGLALVAGALAVCVPARADHARYAPVLTIDAESARTLLGRGGSVAVVDLRPEREFRAGRLPGARSLPLPTLANHLDELPAAAVIILYGDGAVERVAGAYHLVRPRLTADVYVLEGGIDAWRRSGYPLER